jgi:very-long-chain (3R)-3-hydroxyacyl-CoA dehydratase
MRASYLVAYNALLAIAWAACLAQLIRHASGPPQAIWEAARIYVMVPQVLSLLETVHAATGLVRSSPAMALVQWFGRTHALCCILDSVHQVQSSVFGPVMLAVWALSEVGEGQGPPCQAATALE